MINVKKIILIIVCGICICGCTKQEWEKKIQISELKYENKYVSGIVKNLDSTYYKIALHLKSISGNLEEKNFCFIDLKPNETKKINCLVVNIDETFETTVDKVIIEEKEIPSLNEGEISEEALKYHYNEIYELHYSSITPFTLFYENNKDTIFKEIIYENGEISITSSIDNESNVLEFISIHSYYDVNTKKLKNMSLLASTSEKPDDEFLTEITTNIAMMNYFELEDINERISMKINLQNFDLDIWNGCWKVGKWCLSPEVNDAFYRVGIFSK